MLIIAILFLILYVGFALMIGFSYTHTSPTAVTIPKIIKHEKSKYPPPLETHSASSFNPPPWQLKLQPGKGWWLNHRHFDGLPLESYDKLPDSTQNFIESTEATTQGVFLLGMHRSATSLLAGLLVEATSIPVGPNNRLIQPAFDNEKGFYEFRDVVLQNDDIMKYQTADYGNIDNYKPDVAATDVLEMGADVHLDGSPYELKVGKNGWRFNFRKGAEYLGIMSQYPVWLQKDPRMCITASAWYPLLKVPPAVIFTYRPPIEVATSMFKRDGPIFPISRGLRLWLMYNRHALQNADGLCTVFTTGKRVFSDPMQELVRIRSDLKSACNIDLPNTGAIDKSIVDDFLDPSLIHNKDKASESSKQLTGLRGCTYPDWHSSVINKRSQTIEEDLYKKAMQVYCDLESGFVMNDVWNYPWPL